MAALGVQIWWTLWLLCTSHIAQSPASERASVGLLTHSRLMNNQWYTSGRTALAPTQTHWQPIWPTLPSFFCHACVSKPSIAIWITHISPDHLWLSSVEDKAFMFSLTVWWRFLSIWARVYRIAFGMLIETAMLTIWLLESDAGAVQAFFWCSWLLAEQQCFLPMISCDLQLLLKDLWHSPQLKTGQREM